MKEISPQRYLAIGTTMAFGLLALVTLANFLVDPLQFYRRATYPALLHKEARFQNPGLAKNYDYDTVIVGTSVSLGYDAEQIAEQLHGRMLNLALSGGSAHEQSLLLQVALRSGRVRRVIWDLNYEFLRGSPTWVSDYDGSFPTYLYDTNSWNELPFYLLNLDTAKDSLKILLHRYRPTTLAALSALPAKAHGRNRVLAGWRRSRAGTIFTREPEAFAPACPRASFQANYLAVIRAHPDVQFELHFPPISFVYYAAMRTDLPAAFEDFFAWKAELQRQLALQPNTRLFDFQGVPGMVLDLARYSDPVHFDAATHREIIVAIAQGRYLATGESLATAEALIRREATVDWPAHH